jgi:dUTP pyrophosphatase
MERVYIKKLHKDAIIPTKQTKHSSGFDMYVLDALTPAMVGKLDYMDDFSHYVIYPQERVLVRTGIAVQMPPFMEGQVRPRSGFALKHGLTIVNSPATIDADYRGDIGVILLNTSDYPLTIKKGDRIAQLVFVPVFDVNFQELDELNESNRGNGGFGHTGV